MTSIRQDIYRFADVEVDTAQGCIRRGEGEMHLRQQSFQVLLYLLEKHERLVTKDELMNHIWQDTAVTDDVLVQCVGEVRKALGDDPRSPRFIKTIPKVGYRFISPVESVVRNGNVASIATEEITTIELEYEEEHSDSPSSEHEITKVLPQITPRRKLNQKLVIASAVVTLMIVIVPSLIYLKTTNRVSPTTGPEVALLPTAGKHSVAVMYFENQSRNAELDWLREGLTDMLITELSRTKNLTVLGRQQLHSLLQRSDYEPGQNVELNTARDVARRSNVETIVTGSFAKLGESLRIDVQLYDARSGQLTAAESLTVERTDQVLSQLDLLALKLASDLGATPNNQETQARIADVMTNNLEAYRYYSLAFEKAQGLHNGEAIELLRKAVALDPQFAMAHARIGYAYAVTWGFSDKAKPYLEKAFQLSDRLSEKDRLYITAWYAIANLDYGKAIEAFKRLIAQYPLEVEAYERLGRLLGGEEQLEEGIDVLKRGLLVDRDAKDIYNALGAAYSLMGRHSEALAMHQRYVELSPDEPNAHDSLGLSYQWAGQYQQATAEYQRALELNPRFEVVVIHLGNVYFHQGRYREAIDQYQRYIQIAPSEAERARGCDAVARVYWKKRDFIEGTLWAKKAIRHDGHYVMALLLTALEQRDWATAEKLVLLFRPGWNYVSRGTRSGQRQNYYFEGSVALKRGRDDEAIEFFKQAMQRYPPHFDIDSFEDCLANAYLELGRLDEAISEYERILRLNPNYPLAHYHLAKAFEGKGERKQALARYKIFLEVWKGADADIPEVIAARKAING